MATIKKVKKAMMGTKEGPGPKKTVMQKLKIKYPDADTSRTGDVRGTEMNAYADKKTLQRYNDTYNAFVWQMLFFPRKTCHNKLFFYLMVAII